MISYPIRLICQNCACTSWCHSCCHIARAVFANVMETLKSIKLCCRLQWQVSSRAWCFTFDLFTDLSPKFFNTSSVQGWKLGFHAAKLWKFGRFSKSFGRKCSVWSFGLFQVFLKFWPTACSTTFSNLNAQNVTMCIVRSHKQASLAGSWN